MTRVRRDRVKTGRVRRREEGKQVGEADSEEEDKDGVEDSADDDHGNSLASCSG